MAEILIKVQDYVNPDLEKDRRGVHKRGDIINIKPDGWSDHPNWAQSGYPYSNGGAFVLVKVPGVTVDSILSYRDAWRDNFDYEVLSSDPAQGRYTVRVFELNPGTSNQNGMTSAKVENFLTRWGCTDISFTANNCQFTFSLWNAVRSSAFWEVDNIAIKAGFTLIDYVAGTGIGRIQVEIIAPEINENMVLSRIAERGGTVVSNTFPIVVFEIERSDILTRFRQDVKRSAEQVFTRHRYAVLQPIVDSAIAAGGVITLTVPDLTSNLRDKMGE